MEDLIFYSKSKLSTENIVYVVTAGYFVNSKQPLNDVNAEKKSKIHST